MIASCASADAARPCRSVGSARVVDEHPDEALGRVEATPHDVVAAPVRAEEPTEVMDRGARQLHLAVPLVAHRSRVARADAHHRDVLVLAGDELAQRERRFVDLVEAVPPLLRRGVESRRRSPRRRSSPGRGRAPPRTPASPARPPATAATNSGRRRIGRARTGRHERIRARCATRARPRSRCRVRAQRPTEPDQALADVGHLPRARARHATAVVDVVDAPEEVGEVEPAEEGASGRRVAPSSHAVTTVRASSYCALSTS